MNSRHLADACQDTGPPSISLSVAKDVEVKDWRYSALSETPWLRIDFKGAPPAGRWISLTYFASLFDPLVRPLMRCFIGNSYHDEILPGALFGRAIWLGLIPEGTEEIWISPTNRLGPFGFSIESIAMLSTAELIWRCLRRNPGRCVTGTRSASDRIEVCGQHGVSQSAFGDPARRLRRVAKTPAQRSRFDEPRCAAN